MGLSVALWDTSYLNDGVYELMLHVLCEPSGLSFAPLGIDESYSSIVSGVRRFEAKNVSTVFYS